MSEKIKEVKLSEFVENPDNPQTVTDEAFNRLVEKIRKNPNGLRANRIAFVTDHPAGKRVVLSGNKRLRALIVLRGANGTAPAEWFQDITAMTEDERREFLVNSNICEGDWDVDKLLQQFDKDELTDLMGADELGKLLENVTAADGGAAADSGKTEADSVPEVSEKTKSVRGKIYSLGNHILMCGDCTSAADCAAVMSGGKADMIITDPPYNVSIGERNAAINREEKKRGQVNLGGRIEKPIIGNYGWTDEECGEKLWKPAFTNMAEIAADHCTIYVNMPQGGTHMIMMMMIRSAWQVKHELMWLKDQPTFSMGRLDYDYRHEPICYGWKKTHRFFGKGQFTKSVWGIPKPRKSKLHPTMKPVELIENALLNSSQEGEMVADFFGGSGTTLIACEKTGRVCRMMEIDEHYCDVIRKRWAEYVHGEGCDWEKLTPEINERKN